MDEINNPPQNNQKPISDSLKNDSGAYATIYKRNFILDKIKENAPLSISDLQRKVSEAGEKISYGLLWEIVRNFEFCRLISTKIIIDSNNSELKIIYFPKTPDEEGNKAATTGGENAS